ncbi:hypothetical protein C4J81_02430 [Deltaproteobacteria bacterium Smac51]|nr:hypothetical protein C4J81_02430 [Deltaproteobacteria bacterium Smac51]
MYFPVADISLNPAVPVLIGFAVSVLGAPTGISGGFLILPLSINFLGFNSLAVSPTNFIFNILAMPPGLWRLHREKRLMWGLGLLIMLGCLPGIFAGAVLRCTWLKEAADFKIFVALVLTALGLGLLRNLIKSDLVVARAEKTFQRSKKTGGPDGPPLTCTIGRQSICYDFGGESFAVSTPGVVLMSLMVGLIGGIYGIGGAAIIAPVLVSWFRIPIYVVNGASMMAGWAGAIFGLLSYLVFWPLISGEPPIRPDFKLGLMFGFGGMIGIYLGSALQRYLPPRPIKILMLSLILIMAVQNFGLF